MVQSKQTSTSCGPAQLSNRCGMHWYIDSLISLGYYLLNRLATSNSSQDTIALKTWPLSRYGLWCFEFMETTAVLHF